MKKNFIVTEGLDASGKSTQINKLKTYFEKNNIAYFYLHFPQTENKTAFFGNMVAQFLRGEFGDLNNVNPYLVALVYANDRHEYKEQLNSILNENKILLVDRYVYSNIAYQCAKLTNNDEKIKLKKWILELEYKHFNIPQPTLSIFFDVPFSFTQKRLTEERSGEDRNYLKGKADIHEKSLSFQETVRKEYLSLIQTQKDFVKINCTSNSEEMKQPDDIFDNLISVLQEKEIV